MASAVYSPHGALPPKDHSQEFGDFTRLQAQVRRGMSISLWPSSPCCYIPGLFPFLSREPCSLRPSRSIYNLSYSSRP